MINCENVRTIFDCNPEEGLLFWREKKQGRSIGKKVGVLDKDGYLIFFHYGNRYCVHRVIWLYVYGSWPNDQIDHINGNKSDNRILNLREANTAENMRNVGKQSHNTSGLKGISWHKLRKKWRADIKVNQKQIALGLFDCPAAACFAYQIAADKFHGKFARFL